MNIDKFISTSKNLAPSGWKHPQHILDAVEKAEPGRTSKVRKTKKSSSDSKPTPKNQERQSRHLYTSDMTATRLLELRELGYTTAQALFIIRNCGTGSGGFSEGNDCAKGKAGKDGDGDGEFEGGDGDKSSSKGSKSGDGKSKSAKILKTMGLKEPKKDSHDVKLPANPRRLTIDEADAALAQLGYKQQQAKGSEKPAGSKITDTYFKITDEDGKSVVISKDEMYGLVYGTSIDAKGKAGKDGDGDKSSSKTSKSQVDIPDVDQDDPKAVDKAIKGLSKERNRLRDSLGELDQASLKLNEDPRREADKDSSEFKAWQAEDEELKKAIKDGDERWRAIQDRMIALQPYTSEQVARTKADQAAAEAAKKARSRKRRAQRVLAKADEEAGNAAREAAEKEREGKRSFADRLMELRKSGVPVTVAIRMARGQND